VRLLLFLLLLSSLGACARYKAGSFETQPGHAFPEAKTSYGCLDIGMRAGVDSHAEGPVLDIYLGNRCPESVWVDMPALEATAYLEDGQSFPCGLYDPRSELKVALLGGKELAFERIELEAPEESIRICVDLSHLTQGASEGPANELCMQVEA